MRREMLSLFLAVLLVPTLLFAAGQPVAAQESEALVLVPNWFHVAVEPGGQVVISITAENISSEPVDFAIGFVERPGGNWSVELRGSPTSFQVRGVSLTPEETRSLSVEIQVPEGAATGDYGIVVRAVSLDGLFDKTLPLTVTVRAKTVAQKAGPGSVELEPPRYSSLTGTSASEFELGLVLRNRTDDAVNLDLGGLSPPGWSVGFTPSFEQGKRITSVAIEPGAGENVTAHVTPPPTADPGPYAIRLTATGDDSVALFADFEIVVTGSSQLTIAVPGGRLNVNAEAGDRTPISVLVTNTGAIDLNPVSLVSQAPNGWEVTFEPPLINSLGAGETLELAAVVQPPGNAVPGEYRVVLFALSGTAVDSIQMLLTVTQSTVWRWLGAGIVVLVLAGLVGLSVRLGRR